MKWMRHSMLLILLFCFVITKAQFLDNFSDGEFTSNPAWTGNTADWIVNATNKLQSNNLVLNSSFYLSTPSTLANSAQWEFYVNLTFNTSSTNFVDVFLTASSSNLLAPSTTGYFVRLGGTDDDVSLYKKNTGGAIVKIIDGINLALNNSNNTLKIKVIRDATNLFTLLKDASGLGNAYISEGTATDNSFTTSSHFGIAVKQSTASFFQKHFFSDIVVKVFTPDTAPPVIVSATAISSNAVDVLFNESLDNITSQVAANYNAGNAIGFAASATLDAVNNALVHLTFTTIFPNGTNNNLAINGVQDLAGNTLNNASASFSFYTPQQYDIVIDELIADPTPQVGLPNSEWIELRNTSNFPINLQGWRIGDASGISGSLPNFILKPDSFVIVCTSSAVAALAAFGTTLSVSSFPSLDNMGEELYLLSNLGKTIHTVQYNVSWYMNELKQNGGWTLEMVDTKNPCSGVSNWKASTHLSGGTPGKINSVDGVNPDNIAPKLLRAYAIDNLNIVLIFDEPLDSAKAATAANYTISDGIGLPLSAITIGPAFTKVQLKLANAFQPNKIYTISAQSVTDCAGNAIGTSKTARVGLSAVADSLSIVVNEILFNPPSNGNDYVELYNRSNKIIDLGQTYIANRNTAGAVSSISQLSPVPYLFFPEDFLLITENAAWVKGAFITQNPTALLEIATMPGYNDDAGNIIILNAQGKITDEVKYSRKWHFKLLDNVEAVALERIDYNAPSQLESNWHSAASSVNYGTPTYKNSQFRINDGVQGEVKLSPEIVTPDNDGLDDFASIDYSFPTAGYVANITIFDANGRPVKYLQRNVLCGTKGNFRWDGLGESNQQLATGIYIVLTEIFNLSGKKKQFKNIIVVARKS